MKPNSTIWSATVLATVIAAATLAAPAHADVIIDWNAQNDAIVAQKQIRPTAHARTQTLLHLAMFEAVNAVERRYAPAYNFWRPITAIRDADQTDNKATLRDPSWLPLGDTPMHPEYPCAHCITSAAIFAALQGVAGNESGKFR
jgi:hypothetical protein